MSEQGELLRQAVLQVVRQCPQCQRPFEEQDVHLLGQMGGTWLFSLYCHACHTLAVVGLAVNQAAEQVAEKEPGQTPAPPVSMDDVLDMHIFLADLRDFHDL